MNEVTNLKQGDKITAVFAWSENTTFAEQQENFVPATVTQSFFESKNGNDFFRLFAEDAVGNEIQVRWILADGKIVSTGFCKKSETLLTKSESKEIQDFQDEAVKRAEKSELEQWLDNLPSCPICGECWNGHFDHKVMCDKCVKTNIKKKKKYDLDNQQNH